jgi:hypothetical protein
VAPETKVGVVAGAELPNIDRIIAFAICVGDAAVPGDFAASKDVIGRVT